MIEEEIVSLLSGPSSPGSNELCRELIGLADDVDISDLWPVLLRMWPCCDDTWNYRYDMLDLFKNRDGYLLPYVDDDGRAFYESLPNKITVYRGCSRDRIFGLSWTLDRAVAEGFARGHRGMTLLDPVIAEAQVRKADALAVFTDRQESEILIDFTRLRRVAISNQRAMA